MATPIQYDDLGMVNLCEDNPVLARDGVLFLFPGKDNSKCVLGFLLLPSKTMTKKKVGKGKGLFGLHFRISIHH